MADILKFRKALFIKLDSSKVYSCSAPSSPSGFSQSSGSSESARSSGCHSAALVHLQEGQYTDSTGF